MKNGFSMSATIAAHTRARCWRSARAGPDGVYPSVAGGATGSAESRSGATVPTPLSTRDTVAGDTPAGASHVGDLRDPRGVPTRGAHVSIASDTASMRSRSSYGRRSMSAIAAATSTRGTAWGSRQYT